MVEKIKKINESKGIIKFSAIWLIFAFILVVKNYAAEVGIINSSMMAFSYKFGFVSRGLVGTIYQVLNKITPFNLMDYDSVLKFTTLVSIIFVFVLFVFFLICIAKCKDAITEEIKILVLFYSIFSVPTFFIYEHLGRFDVYCILLSLLGAIVLLLKKAEWLVVLFAAFGVMVHQGNVFMFLNIILILLLYRAMSSYGAERLKYVLLLVSSFVVASVLFVYFEFFSHVNGNEIYNDVLAVAASLGKNGGIHTDVIDHEILGLDLSSREYIFRLRNIVEFVIYVVLMLPYIILGIKFFRNVIRCATSIIEKWKYVFVAIGAGTMLPMLLLKCDFGRWMFAIISYYFVVILALLGLNDEIVEKELKKIILSIEKNRGIAMLLFAYPFLLTPFEDVEITYVVSKLADVVNNLILHWW